MTFGFRKEFFCLCLVMLLFGCQNFMQVLTEADYNAVESLYSKGLKAKRAQKWEEAYRYFLKAYTTSRNEGGILRFPDKPKKNNYRYTYSLISRKMDEVAKHLDERRVKLINEGEDLGGTIGRMGAPMKEKQKNIQQDIQQEILESIMVADKKFKEVEELARRQKYLEAIEMLKNYISEHPTDGGTNQARKLIKEYGKKLDERRRELYEAVGMYIQEDNFPLARELLLKMKETYPKGLESQEALKYIDKLLKDISDREKKLGKKKTEKEQDVKQQKPVGQ